MPPVITLITGTYNQPKRLLECAESVLKQTRGDWHWWIVLNGQHPDVVEAVRQVHQMDTTRISPFILPVSDQERQREYIPAKICNGFFPLVYTKYFAWLSDDDLLEPCFCEALIEPLERNPDWDIAYGRCLCVGEINQKPRWVGSDRNLGPGTGGGMPDCVIDGGQIVQTKRSYDALNGWKFPTCIKDSNHVDGIYMNQLAYDFVFHFVNVHVLTHRCTDRSSNQMGTA